MPLCSSLNDKVRLHLEKQIKKKKKIGRKEGGKKKKKRKEKKKSGRFLKKLKMQLPYDPAIPLLGIPPERMKTVSEITKPQWGQEIFFNKWF